MPASGVLVYNIPVVPARTEPGEEAYCAALGSFSTYVNSVHPNTENLIEGWHWDERTWTDEYTDNEVMCLPAVWDPTTSGITQSYFQSGIGSNHDLELMSIKFLPSSGLNEVGVYRVWAPEINHGYYYDYEDQGYLFSDDSEVQTVSYSGIVTGITTATNFNEVTLSGFPKTGIPIQVSRMIWDNTLGKYEISTNLRKKINFTGTRDENLSRQSTYDSNTQGILWDNIDQDEQEFIVTYSGDYPKIICNNQYVELVGSGVSVTGLEFIGISDGSAGQQFHTLYSPIDSTMDMEIYSYITTSGTITSWEPIDTDVNMSGYQVRVDYDLGTLEFADPSVSGQYVPSAGSTIGIRYWKTLRVEYEPQNTGDTVVATEVSVNPIYRRSARGFIYLSNKLEDPASIVLEAQLPEIQTDIFGPLYIGNTYAPIIATVYDVNGQELEGQTVTFSIISDPVVGSFGGTNISTISVTDYKGEARSFYNPPRSINDIGEDITASGWSYENYPTDPEYSGLAQITTLHTENILIEGDVNDIFLYEVHVDDPLQGYLDVTQDHNNLDIQLSGYYTSFFQEQEIYGPTGLDPSGLSPTENAIEWEATHRLIWELSRPTIFQPNTGMGRKKLVSALDATMLNPHDFTQGAVGPIQPINVTSAVVGEYDVVFDTSTYSIPIPTGTQYPTPSGTLYSYFLVAPTTVTMQASVFNERLNQNILSNEISVKLNIPSYLSGLWILDAINQSHIDEISAVLASGITASGQRIPLGFRLRSSNITLAAALDGITFLDVNVPVMSGLGHQININGIL